MKKILAIGASNSSKSINKAFAIYTAGQLSNTETIEIDLNDLEMPLYGPDLEAEKGIPENAKQFLRLIGEADGIVLSLAEYNGMVTTAFKNLWDWTSRLEPKLWQNKPILLMAASPGGRGGANALNIMKNLIPHQGGQVTALFSLPNFYRNFSEEGLTNIDLKKEFEKQLLTFRSSLNK